MPHRIPQKPLANIARLVGYLLWRFTAMTTGEIKLTVSQQSLYDDTLSLALYV
jgi:hypothetical protein